MSHTRSGFSKIIISLWLIYGGLSYLFSTTKGLAYRDVDSITGISFVRDLESSGGKDNICIELGILFASLAIIWGICRINKDLNIKDLAVYALLLMIQTIFLQSIEMGSIIDTIFYNKNGVLALWVIVYLMLCGSIAGKVVFGKTNE